MLTSNLVNQNYSITVIHFFFIIEKIIGRDLYTCYMYHRQVFNKAVMQANIIKPAHVK